MKTKSYLVFLLLIGLPLMAVDAQDEIPVTVKKQGSREFLVDVQADRQSSLDVFSAICSKTSFELNVASPEVSQILAAEIIDVNLKDIDLVQLINLLGMSCGLDAAIDEEKLAIRIKKLPPDTDETAHEFYREKAIVAVYNAFGADSEPESEIELLLRTGDLHYAGGKMDQAFEAYRSFVNKFASHERSTEVLIAAARAAYSADRHADVRTMTNKFITTYPSHPNIGEIVVVAAKSLIAEKNLNGAIVLLKNIVRRSRDKKVPERQGLIAEYMLAELHHKSGNDTDAISILEKIEIGHDPRLNADLLRQVRLYFGICRNSQGDYKNAIHDLKLGALECPTPKLRIKSLLLQAEAYLALDDGFNALAATRVASQLKPSGAGIFRARHLQGRAYHLLALPEKARSTLVNVVLESPKLLKDDPDRHEKVSRVVSEIGDILFEQRLYADALASF